MFELVERLFSPQVARQTDRLHAYKLVVVIISMTLLFGYSMLRDDFYCQGHGGVSDQTMTRFCFMNGTTTTVAKKNHEHSTKFLLTHTGMGFAGDETQIIVHNYMRSQWLILFGIGVLSCAANWWCSSLYSDKDELRALLRLGNWKELRLVRDANTARPYESLFNTSSLSALKAELDTLKAQLEEHGTPDRQLLARCEHFSDAIAKAIGKVNSDHTYDEEHDHHPNFLLHTLLTDGTPSTRPGRALVIDRLVSFLASIAQFGLPLLFISPAFFFFGLNYLLAAGLYVHDFFSGERAYDINSLDYELSSHIFPTETQCEYKQTGYSSTQEKFTTRCTAASNEIYSKEFLVIWWLLFAGIIAGACSLFTVLIASTSCAAMNLIFGMLYWPEARAEAERVARFGREYAHLRRKVEIIRRPLPKQVANGVLTASATEGRQISADNEELTSEAHLWERLQECMRSLGAQTSGSAFNTGNWPPAMLELRRKPRLRQESDCDGDTDGDDDGASADSRRRFLDKKLREVEEGRIGSIYVAHSHAQPRHWYDCSLSDAGRAVRASVRRLTCGARRGVGREEVKPDMNVYVKLYLLYLREGGSKVEETIKKAAHAADVGLCILGCELLIRRELRAMARQVDSIRKAAAAQRVMVENLLRSADLPEVAENQEHGAQVQPGTVDEPRPLCNLV